MKLNFKVIFLSFFNIVFLNIIIISNIAISFFPHTAYFIPFFLFIISAIIYMLIPDVKNNFVSKVLKGKFTRINISIYLYTSSVFLLYVTYRIISFYFYFITPTYLLIIVSLFFIMIIGFVTIKNILSLTIIHYFLIFILTFFVIFNNDLKDFRLILPLSFKFEKGYRILGLVGMYLDNVMLLFVPIKESPVSKWNFIIGAALGALFTSWFILDSYTFLSYKFFENLDFPALYRYKLYTGPHYIEHLDNFLNLFICSYMLSKVLFNFELFRIYIKKKNSIYYRFVIFLITSFILIALYYFIPFKSTILYVISIILTVLITIVILSLRRYKRE